DFGLPSRQRCQTTPAAAAQLVVVRNSSFAPENYRGASGNSNLYSPQLDATASLSDIHQEQRLTRSTDIRARALSRVLRRIRRCRRKTESDFLRSRWPSRKRSAPGFWS